MTSLIMHSVCAWRQQHMNSTCSVLLQEVVVKLAEKHLRGATQQETRWKDKPTPSQCIQSVHVRSSTQVYEHVLHAGNGGETG